MDSRLLCFAPMLATLLVGCSGNSSGVSEEDPEQSGSQAGKVFFAGLSCSGSSTAITSASGTPTDSGIDSPVVIQSGSEIVDCSADVVPDLTEPGVANTGEGSLTNDFLTANISSAAIDIEIYNQTAEVGLFLHDGNTRSSKASSTTETENGTSTLSRVDWGIYDASIALAIVLYQANTEEFTGGSFEIIVDYDLSPSNLNYSDFATLIRDGNGDGVIDDPTADGKRAVSGNINVTGESPNWSVTFDITLDDGSTLTGDYNGDFHQLPQVL